MKKYNVLVLTDHNNHSKENSLYPLVGKMLIHPLSAKIDIATRANKDNNDFFYHNNSDKLLVSPVTEDFAFTKNGLPFTQGLKESNLAEYDLVWLRMPPPLTTTFLDFIGDTFKHQCVINNPKGIFETGSKAFLTNFQDYCPPMKICSTKADIIEFKSKFPIVLKPFREYGGKGIVKIDGDHVWIGQEESTFDNFINSLPETKLDYLGVKFLKNVSKGDKRIVVVNGKIMGASLRLPPKDSWLCNVAMGGSAHLAEVDPEEEAIVAAINPILSKLGIAMYGVDTLVGDDGKRILSEINTTSIGGLPQIATMRELPLVEEAIDLIWAFFLKKNK